MLARNGCQTVSEQAVTSDRGSRIAADKCQTRPIGGVLHNLGAVTSAGAKSLSGTGPKALPRRRHLGFPPANKLSLYCQP
jgi:hypothetical protein